jgi:hypothetical protein
VVQSIPRNAPPICAASGGGGAPTTAQYWTGAADATLSAEKNLGVLGTGLVLNTGGVPSAYTGTTAGANQWITALSASGVGTFAQPAFTNISGTAAVGQIPALAYLPVAGAAASANLINGAVVTVANHSATGTPSATTYYRGDNTWSTPSGGGGGGNFVRALVDFGTEATNASLVVTGQAWVTASSVIVCSPSLVATSSHAEGAEDPLLEGLTVAAHTRVVGTGFTVAASVANGVGNGVYAIDCTGGDGSAVSSLSASATPTSVSGYCSALSGSCTATTASSTCSGTGGSGSYTYAWSSVSGDAATANSPTSAASTFSRTQVVVVAPGGVFTGSMRCTVNDGFTTATADVVATTTHERI